MAIKYVVKYLRPGRKAEDSKSLLQKIKIYLSNWPSPENRDEVTSLIDRLSLALNFSRMAQGNLFLDSQTQFGRISKLISHAESQDVLLPGTIDKAIQTLLNLTGDLSTLAVGIRSEIEGNEELQRLVKVEEVLEEDGPDPSRQQQPSSTTDGASSPPPPPSTAPPQDGNSSSTEEPETPTSGGHLSYIS